MCVWAPVQHMCKHASTHTHTLTQAPTHHSSTHIHTTTPAPPKQTFTQPPMHHPNTRIHHPSTEPPMHHPSTHTHSHNHPSISVSFLQTWHRNLWPTSSLPNSTLVVSRGVVPSISSTTVSAFNCTCSKAEGVREELELQNCILLSC